MDLLLGAFGMAVITGVFTFATMMINSKNKDVDHYRDDVKFYRDTLLTAFEHQQKSLEDQQRSLEALAVRLRAGDL